MAIKYLDAKRLQGTNAERLAMSTEASPTYSNTFTSTTDFSTTSTSDANVNDTVAGALWHDVERSATNRSGQWDLGSTLSDTAWTLRFQSNTTTVSGTSATTRTFIGMDSNINSSGANSDHKFIGTASMKNSARSIWYPLTVKENSLDVGDDDSTTYALSVATIYIEIRRKTSTTYSVRWTTSSDYTGGTLKSGTVGEDGGSGTCDSLQYFSVKNVNVDGSSPYCSIIGNIPLIEIWDGSDGIPLVHPDLPNGTIFNETDTYKYFMFDGTDTWNQMVSS